jgi:hypothetical protein
MTKRPTARTVQMEASDSSAVSLSSCLDLAGGVEGALFGSTFGSIFGARVSVGLVAVGSGKSGLRAGVGVQE